MSIRARIDDASLLWRNDRREGALLNALSAVAATSRKRYGDRAQLSDRQAFERFLRDSTALQHTVNHRRACQPVSRVLYQWFRSELVCEQGLPVDLALVPGVGPCDLSVSTGRAPDGTLRLSESWFQHCVASVMLAPENNEPWTP